MTATVVKNLKKINLAKNWVGRSTLTCCYFISDSFWPCDSCGDTFCSATGMVCFESGTLFSDFACNLRPISGTLKGLDSLTTTLADFMSIFFSMDFGVLSLRRDLFCRNSAASAMESPKLKRLIV